MQEKKALSSRGRGRLRGFLELRRPWGFSPEARRGSQGASRAAPGKSGLHARGEGERVLALESREGTRASRRVEEGLSRSLSGGGGKPSCPSPSAGDLRELPRVPLRGEGSCGGGGAPRDSAGSGATEEGLTSRGGRNLRLPLRFGSDGRVPAELGQESHASSCLRKGTPLASRVVRGFQAPGRAVCGTRGSFRMMHGGVSAPSCCAFIHRVAFKEVSGHRVLFKSVPENWGLQHVVPPTRLRLF